MRDVNIVPLMSMDTDTGDPDAKGGRRAAAALG